MGPMDQATQNFSFDSIMDFPDPSKHISPTDNREAIGTGGNLDGEGRTFSSLRRQSTSSLTANSDASKALSIITEMLEGYTNMIESNTNSINQNAVLQNANYGAMRSVLDSIIDAVNGISQRASILEDVAQANGEKLTSISDLVLGEGDSMLHSKLDQFRLKVEENTRDIAYLKDCVESSSESMNIIENRLGSIEGRVSNIERLLMKHNNQRKNHVSAKMA